MNRKEILAAAYSSSLQAGCHFFAMAAVRTDGRQCLPMFFTSLHRSAGPILSMEP